MSQPTHISQEAQYLLVVVGLFIVPRVLQRFRIPSAITCVGLGALLGMGFGLFQHDGAVSLLSTLGIVSLFLFAGLEVEFRDLLRGLSVTLGHLALQILLIACGALLFGSVFELAWRPALLFSLAIFTPSTGFILDSLGAFGLSAQQQFWVKTKAISTELVALVALFFAVQSSSAGTLALSTLALGAMIVLLPWIFQLFASWVLPYAPKSEFAFLTILALVCASVTRQLGVYYLVGAFVVGVTAVRLRKRLPALASERMLTGIALFASFFIPFYFFKAGLRLESDYFGARAILLGLSLVAITVPLRVAIAAAFRRVALKEPWPDGVRVGISLVPTLVFSMVLADILRERFALSDTLFGALIVFALVNTALPGFILKAAPPDFTEPEAASAAPEPAEPTEADPAPRAPAPPPSADEARSAEAPASPA